MNRTAAAVLTAGLVISTAGPALAAPETLRFLTKETSNKDTKTGFIFTENLLVNGKKVGTDRAVCTTVFKKGAKEPTGANCRVTLTLPKGTVIVRAPISFAKPGGTLTVLGGTGGYKGAAGGGTFADAPKDQTLIVVNLK